MYKYPDWFFVGSSVRLKELSNVCSTDFLSSGGYCFNSIVPRYRNRKREAIHSHGSNPAPLLSLSNSGFMHHPAAVRVTRMISGKAPLCSLQEAAKVC